MICHSSVIKPPASARGGWLVIALLFSFGAIASGQESSRAFLKGPYLQAPGADTMTILWESPTNRPGVVHYGLKGRRNQELWLDAPRELILEATKPGGNVAGESVPGAVFLYEMTLTNLAANSVYTYSAETDGVRTPIRKFRTFGAHPNKVTFIAYGDTRSNPRLHAAIAANFKRYSPDFILHTGDLVSAGKRYDVWGKEFFEPLAQVIDEVPILPAIGNHEQDGINYLHYLHLPGKQTAWYAYDVGPVHVLSLDYRYEKATDEQFAFAQRDLQTAKAPWKVVILHVPMFNIGGHGSHWGHAAYLPLFHQAKVDLVIGGHSHIYERFHPVVPTTGPDAWPITHITTGGGGAPLYTTMPHPALASQVATNHFLVIEATPTKLKGRAFTTNNTLIDSFEMKKSRGRAAVMAKAKPYSEELLNLAFDVAPSLTAELAAVPGTDSPAKVMFTIRPLAKVSAPVELEIGLTPDSAAYYELKEGPVRVTSPGSTESNRVVWATVRATGQKSADAAGTRKELSPALVFQARIRSGSGETLAYGQKSKVSQAAAEAAKK
ncbi:MAG: metallophosphoesterase family protein [Verrucomicrobia bacterium]|nr:metallophosphoesterase family protein [Verrucomicrobiota bacterium]